MQVKIHLSIRVHLAVQHGHILCGSSHCRRSSGQFISHGCCGKGYTAQANYSHEVVFHGGNDKRFELQLRISFGLFILGRVESLNRLLPLRYHRAGETTSQHVALGIYHDGIGYTLRHPETG